MSNNLPKLSKKIYEKELQNLQIELVKLQEWIKQQGLKVVILFEGRDAAGKGGAIKSITQSLNPRICRVVALGKPSDQERTQWYFQRYTAELPAAGEMVLFDRSWYNRAGVEHVMGYCSHEEYVEFLRSCPEFENMIQRSGIILIKYWFSVNDGEQEKDFAIAFKIHANAGSSVRWIWRRGRVGWNIPKRRMICSMPRIHNYRLGM